MNLNKNKKSSIDSEFLSIINLSKKVSDLTDWYFDITILPIIENIWYWIFKKKLEENIWYKNIEIDNRPYFFKKWNIYRFMICLKMIYNR